MLFNFGIQVQPMKPNYWRHVGHMALIGALKKSGNKRQNYPAALEAIADLGDPRRT